MKIVNKKLFAYNFTCNVAVISKSALMLNVRYNCFNYIYFTLFYNVIVRKSVKCKNKYV